MSVEHDVRLFSCPPASAAPISGGWLLEHHRQAYHLVILVRAPCKERKYIYLRVRWCYDCL